jgi:hypothetical protein
VSFLLEATRLINCRAHGEAMVREILEVGKGVLGLTEAKIAGSPGSDDRKEAIARLIWERTSVSQGWIANELGMSTGANVSQQIKRNKGFDEGELLKKAMRRS